MQMIKDAPEHPGGDSFTIATENLNQYFAGASPKEFLMDPDAREYLLKGVPPQTVRDLENPQFTIRDARHIEDCLLYHTIAARVGGDGDDLTRVRRVFDWMVRQVQLVPPQSLAPPGLSQAQARPYDVLLRGMATEEGEWAERSWLFMALCRQLGVDVGLILYNRPLRGFRVSGQEGNPPERYLDWIAAALIDGKAYLFDARIGMPIPSADGKGVATFEEAATNPAILAALDIPALAPYSTTQADLAASKIRIKMDSTYGYLSPRMRNLQKNLFGKNRMVLYRDPAEQAAAFAKAFGPRFEAALLWDLPRFVEQALFTSPQFVQASQFAITLFDAKLPLLPARMGQLRGAVDEAIEKYVSFRKPETPEFPPQVQQALDLYATYFLGLAKLDKNDAKGAEFFFNETLRIFPQPGRNQPYFNMYRWGAETNLALLNDAQGNTALAIRYYNEPKPTKQYHGDLLRARDLVWKDPFVPDAAIRPVQGPKPADGNTQAANAGPRAVE
jgi:hypothetical protein